MTQTQKTPVVALNTQTGKIVLNIPPVVFSTSTQVTG